MTPMHIRSLMVFAVLLFLVVTGPDFHKRLNSDQVTCIDDQDNVHQVQAHRVERPDEGGLIAWYDDEMVGDFTGMRCARVSPEMQ